MLNLLPFPIFSCLLFIHVPPFHFQIAICYIGVKNKFGILEGSLKKAHEDIGVMKKQMADKDAFNKLKKTQKELKQVKADMDLVGKKAIVMAKKNAMATVYDNKKSTRY